VGRLLLGRLVVGRLVLVELGCRLSLCVTWAPNAARRTPRRGAGGACVRAVTRAYGP
jgi:hypothetical protein